MFSGPFSEQQCQLATLSPGLDYQPKSMGGSNITVAKAIGRDFSEVSSSFSPFSLM